MVGAPGVLGNDNDPEGNPLTAVLLSTTSHGTLNFNSDGSFSYTPNADFNGTDTFTYTAANTSGSDLGVVTIQVFAPPAAAGDGYATLQNTPLTVPAGAGVLANDTPNGAVISAYAASTAQGGSVRLNG